MKHRIVSFGEVEYRFMALVENVLGVIGIDCSDGIKTEDYNQIDPHVLDCFPRRKFPVNLFHWKQDIRVLSPIYIVGGEVNHGLRTTAQELSEQGLLYFSRDQITEYTECLACEIDVALQDPNLTWNEFAGLFIHEIDRRQKALFASPMPQQSESLQSAVESLCTQLLDDTDRISNLVKEVHIDLSINRRRINSSIIAIGIYLELNKGNIYLDSLVKVAMGFLLYDIGMSRLSPMMLAKPQQFTTSEKRLMREHPNTGLQLLEKLNLTLPEITQPMLQHHERLNGTGYPEKLKADAIGELGRIAGVADSYCAMITDNRRRTPKSPINAAADLVMNERKYDQAICRTLVKFLQTVQK